LRHLGEPEVRQQILQTLTMSGLSPDDLYLEDLIALLDSQQSQETTDT